MYVLSLEVTKKCNLSCSYCYVDKKVCNTIDIEVARKALDLAIHEALKQNDKKLHIYFIGGEPLVAFDTIKLCIEYVESKHEYSVLNISYSTTTNGTLLNEAVMEYLIKKNFDLKISIDGERDVHNRNRKFADGKGSYEQVISKMPLINRFEKERGVPVHVANVISDNTKKDFLSSLIHLKNLGFTYIETDLNLDADWSGDNILVLLEQLDSAFRFYIDSRNNKEKWYWKFYESYLEAFVSDAIFYPCKAGLVSVFINSEGQAFPCIETDQDLNIGNVFDGLDAGKIRKIVSISCTENTECLRCKEYKNFRCKACSCININYLHTKNFFISPKVKCDVTKYVFEYFERIYSKEQIEILKDFYKKRRH